MPKLKTHNFIPTNKQQKHLILSLRNIHEVLPEFENISDFVIGHNLQSIQRR